MSQRRKMLRFTGLGFEIVTILLLCVWLGGYLDGRFAGRGLWTGILVFLGLIVWMAHVVLLLRGIDKQHGS